MDLALLIEICSLYGRLGWAVQEQLDNLVQEPLDIEALKEGDYNPNALNLIAMFLDRLEGKVDDDVFAEAEQLIKLIREYGEHSKA